MFLPLSCSVISFSIFKPLNQGKRRYDRFKVLERLPYRMDALSPHEQTLLALAYCAETPKIHVRNE